MREVRYGLICLCHTHEYTRTAQLIDLYPFTRLNGSHGLASWCEHNLNFASGRQGDIHAAILAASSVRRDNDWLLPALNVAPLTLDDDRLSKHGASAQALVYRHIWRFKALLEPQSHHIVLIYTVDGRTFDPNPVPLDGRSCLDSHLITRLFSISYAQIKILDINVEVPQYQLLLNQLPHHLGHLVPTALHKGIFDFYFQVLAFHYILNSLK